MSLTEQIKSGEEEIDVLSTVLALRLYCSIEKITISHLIGYSTLFGEIFFALSVEKS